MNASSLISFARPGKIWLSSKLRPLLLGSLALLLAGPVQAQNFNLLHTFAGATDGGRSVAELTQLGDTLYGTTGSGGPAGGGTIFSIKTDGTGFNVLYNFTAAVDDGSGTGNLTNSDGSMPSSGLTLLGDTFYGSAAIGGRYGSGVLFSIKTNGTGFTIVHTFSARMELYQSGSYTNGDGSGPNGTLLLSGNTLYGTANQGGGSDIGTVFKVDTDGNNFTTLHSFTFPNSTDGAHPAAGLLLIGNTLYGTTYLGSVIIDGSVSQGTVYKVDTDGGNFTTLHSFPTVTYPSCRLITTGGMLYGTTFKGGTMQLGSVFTMDTNGNNFATLHDFLGGNDGDNPYAGLILSGNTLYGVTSCAHAGSGTVFSLKPDGSNFTTLFSFNGGGGDGQSPYGELILSGGTLYGTTLNGGTGSVGTLFSLTLPCSSAAMSIAQYAGITISGTIGCTYEIDYTTNLSNPVWIPLATNTLASNPYLFIDTNAVSGSRFYQAITQ